MAPTARWTKLCEDDSIRRSSQALAIAGDSAYIFGGELRPREPVDSSVYQIPTKPSQNQTQHPLQKIPFTSQQQNQETPQPRVGHAATTLRGKIYIFSGRSGVAMAPIEEHGSFWVFDPTQNSWSRLTPKDPDAPYPQGRSYHALTAADDDSQNTIFLHAGCPESGRLHDLWSFDVSNRTWRELPSAPGPERGGTSVAYLGGKLYRMNGFDGKTEQGGRIDVFDLGQARWLDKESIEFVPDGVNGPPPRSVSCLVPVNLGGGSNSNKPGLLTMFGERDPSSLGHQGAGKMLADVWLFDLESKSWTELELRLDGGGEKPVPRGWFGAAPVGANAVVVHGGLSESNQRLGDVWLLEPLL
ncbi:hypothetical protein HRR83_001991 [Exophiala dermatitidis]|uniref:Kelch repeat-containing protein n=2 Tax=Exophiala dermatitidis TaxID=5970 RepID=H6BZ66_EXODN|nr:uncharacterized protein HMPREF1120_04993 [Exophiala dermatitidis NIH/UT8656]KAJ4514360.1 hypothetical protein HRR73_005386 [Exophiala dermatitidis]EHY56929.1 hypothetical protein HMPREF1120_04993 [Exophiala dermatitidis NIH/UT8656]KAJ4520035.1 hypothetical protein HRR75_001898 [Exophiala dermatitidis]KAJ4523873.1 hypothetical protein HRR74_002068 [Exophiala dermatitidis]KAJ4537187.1 hypothetical protein HRR76_005200 [Exophiala dermatitidis]